MEASLLSPKPSVAETAHWRPLGTLIWGAVVATVFIVVQTAVVISWASSMHVTAQDKAQFHELFAAIQTNGLAFSLCTFATTLACVPLLLGIAKLKRNSVIADYFALKAVNAKVMWRWLAALATVMALSDLLTISLGRPVVPPFMAAIYRTAHPPWPLWGALVIAAPLFEETFFRGFLYKGLEASLIRPAGAIVATAAAWAVIHAQYGTYEIATIFVLGLLLGISRAQSKSLFVPLALHSACNLAAGIEAALLR